MSLNITSPRAESPIQEKTHNSLAKNIMYLYILLFAEYFLPLIAVPYLVRVLGPTGYGTVSFAQGLIFYLKIITDYGFDWYATRAISVERYNIQKVSYIASTVWVAKSLLCGVCFLFLLGLILLAPKVRENDRVIVLLFGIVVGSVFFPSWLFQGIEKMRTITTINLTVRIFATIAIFLCIRQASDVLIYAAILALQYVGAGIIGLWIACKKFEVQLIRPRLRDVFLVLIDGWPLFLSASISGIYTVGNAFILGLFTNNTIVGYYSAAEKIVRLTVGLLSPISRAFYPRMNAVASKSTFLTRVYIKRLLLLTFVIGISLFISLLVGAALITQVLLGPAYEESIIILKILSILPLLIGLNNVLGVQIMLSFGWDKPFSRTIIGAAALCIVLSFLLCPLWQGKGMATAVISSETLAMLIMAVFLIRRGFLNLKVDFQTKEANIPNLLRF
jgi:PST family polysaccharide transporter